MNDLPEPQLQCGRFSAPRPAFLSGQFCSAFVHVRAGFCAGPVRVWLSHLCRPMPSPGAFRVGPGERQAVLCSVCLSAERGEPLAAPASLASAWDDFTVA